MKRRAKHLVFFLASVVVLGLLGYLAKAFVLQAPASGTWQAASPIAEARAGAAAVLLNDGRVLVTGGEGTSGARASAELFNADGSFSLAAPMLSARSKHAAVVLNDGRVLVAGGAGTDGSASSAAELYDPTANSWSPAGALLEARSGHTATLLQDGRVLIAGGENSGTPSSSLEIYNPIAGAFAPAGSLSWARKNLAAALLADGRVLIVGGSDGTNALASSDIYDPASGSVTPGPALAGPRAGHSATALLDGTVLVAGGNNGNADLNSAEIFDPTSGTFTPAPSTLTAPRANHLALLLPHNNSVLIVGGASSGVVAATAELYIPWTGGFVPTGSPFSARRGAAGSALSLDGAFLVAGGNDGTNNLNSSELYGFATVKTDKGDYAPGEIVTITGSGWQPGETVNLLLHEAVNPPFHPDRTIAAVADASGNIFDNSFSPEAHDVGVRFYLTASGAASQAQTTFTDGANSVGSVSVAAQSGTLTYGTAGSATFAVTVNRASGAGTSGVFSAALSLTTALPTGATAAFSPSTVSFLPSDSSKTSTLTITTTSSTSAGGTSFTVKALNTIPSSTNSATGIGTLTINKAHLTVTADSASRFYGDANPSFTATLTGFKNAETLATSGVTGSASLTTTATATSSVAGSPYTITAALGTLAAGNYDFTPFVNGELTINKTHLTVTADNQTKTYDGAVFSPFTATLSGFVNSETDAGLRGSGTLSGSAGFSGAATTAVNAGSYTITPTAGTLTATNYDFTTFDNGTLTISKRDATWTTNANSKTYGDSDPNPLTTGSGSNFVAADNVTASYSRAAGETVLGGPYHITATLSPVGVLGNYNITNNGANFTITPRPITVTADAKTKILNAPDPALTYQITSGNLVNGDTFSGSLTRDPGEAVGAYAIKQGTLALSSNYTLTYVGANLRILYSTGPCLGSPGHQILQPINADGSSVFKSGSTVPVKFRVCDATGVSIGTPGVVSSFVVAGYVGGTVSSVNETITSTTPDTAFRWDPTSQQWIFNLSTSGLAKNATAVFTIMLNDGTIVGPAVGGVNVAPGTTSYQFGLK